MPYPDNFSSFAFDAAYGVGDEAEAPAWMYRKMDNLRAEENKLDAALDLHAEDDAMVDELYHRLADNEAEQIELQERIDEYEHV